MYESTLLPNVNKALVVTRNHPRTLKKNYLMKKLTIWEAEKKDTKNLAFK